MGLVVDPTFTPPPPPARVESADHRLTALLDAGNAGCTLKADFAERVLRTNLDLNPSHRSTGASAEVRRNLAQNPRGVGAGGFSQNNGSMGTTTKNVAVAGNPDGIATAVKLTPTGYVGTTNLASVYNVDAAGVSTTSRGVGLWVYSTLAGKVVLYCDGDSIGSRTIVDIPANTWQWVATAKATTGNAICAVQNTTPNATAADFAYMTGVLSVAGVDSPSRFFDGSTAAGDGLTYSWDGAADASESVASGFLVQQWSGAPGTWVRGPVEGDGYVMDIRGGLTNLHSSPFPGAAVGQFYAARVTLSAVPGEPTSTAKVMIFDGTGYVSGESVGVALPADGTPVTFEVLPTAATTNTQPRLYVYKAAGQTVRVHSGVIVEQVSGIGVPVGGGSFDGSTPADEFTDYRWTGAADASTSEAFAPALVDSNGDLPDLVRFLRDELPVRSGDPAQAPGGVAVAYDHEPPLGKAASWTAVPVFRDGTEGTPSEAAVLAMPEDLTDVHDVWLKSPDDPSLSVKVLVTVTPTMTRKGRTSLEDVPGARDRIGSWDLRGGYDYDLAILTDTAVKRAAVEALLDSGPLLMQTVTAVDLDDLFVLPGDVSWTWIEGSRESGRSWAVAVSEIGRPPTTGAPLRIPGRSCSQVATDYASCDALTAQVGSCLELLGVS